MSKKKRKTVLANNVHPPETFARTVFLFFFSILELRRSFSRHNGHPSETFAGTVFLFFFSFLELRRSFSGHNGHPSETFAGISPSPVLLDLESLQNVLSRRQPAPASLLSRPVPIYTVYGTACTLPIMTGKVKINSLLTLLKKNKTF